MKLSALKSVFVTGLAGMYDASEAESIFSFAAEELLHEKDLGSNREIPEELVPEFVSVLTQLLTHEPVQYIFNKSWFGQLPLFVNYDVLIPRPETEELCHIILKENTGPKLRVLDIGTGSGCIPAYLGIQRPDWEFLALDNSSGALQVAAKNMEDLGLQGRMKLQEMDFLKEFPEGDFDLIVSNPPYISMEEFGSMEANVLDWEPYSALFTGTNDALIFYRRIAELFEQTGKEAWMEINPKFEMELLEIFSKWVAGIIPDMYGKSRFLHVKK